MNGYKRNLVDVLSSKECLNRALDAANELFLTLEDRGHRVLLGPDDAGYLRFGFSHRDGDKKANEQDFRYSGQRGPAKPTLVFIDTVAIGLAVFELSEEVEVRSIGGEPGYARIGSPEEKAAPRRSHDWTTRRWLVSGRLAVRAYAPHGGVRWERCWKETKPGELPTMFAAMTRLVEQHRHP